MPSRRTFLTAAGAALAAAAAPLAPEAPATPPAPPDPLDALLARPDDEAVNLATLAEALGAPGKPEAALRWCTARWVPMADVGFGFSVPVGGLRPHLRRLKQARRARA